MTITVHSVNHRGSEEYSIHILGKGQPKVVSIFYKADKAENRQRAIETAREIAAQHKVRYVMSHGLSGRAFDRFLPDNAKVK